LRFSPPGGRADDSPWCGQNWIRPPSIPLSGPLVLTRLQRGRHYGLVLDPSALRELFHQLDPVLAGGLARVPLGRAGDHLVVVRPQPPPIHSPLVLDDLERGHSTHLLSLSISASPSPRPLHQPGDGTL
jgi:hypothetical protein